MTNRDHAIKRYAFFAALRVVAYLFLAFVLVFGYTPIAVAADGDDGGTTPAEPVTPGPPAPAVDFSQLNTAIANAQSALGMYPVYDSDPSEVDEGVQYVTSAAIGALQSAIAQGQSVAANTSATQDQVNAETNAVVAAHSQFFASVLTGTKQAAPEPALAIDGVSIYLKDTDDCIATDLGDYTQLYPGVQELAHITKNGGYLEFDYVTHWNNGDTSPRNDGSVTWWSSDPSIASFNSYRLEPHKDGVVKIRADVDAGKTGGSELYAEATVKVDGQEGAVYITEIRIMGPDGDNVTNGIYEMKESLSTAQAQFMAEVDVFDPTTNATTTYTTDGRLSQQVPDLGDLTWAVGDPALGSIIENTGMFRPARYAMVAVMVSSLAGFGGATVTASAVVSTINPDEEEQGDEYHPQDSLTIKAYYELQPPSEYGEDAYVIDDTYSLGDLQALGALTAYYTAFGSAGDYYTMQGTGVPLSAVLRESGVNLDGIKHFAFRTADWPDGENRPVTASFVFADRYYYPNIDIGSFADAVQVYPILAWSSSQIRNSTNLNIPMTEATRFRLLFGATPAGGNSQYQIKWINTIVVVLSGGPPADDGSGEGGGDGEGDGDDGGGSDGELDPDPNQDTDDEQGDGTSGEGDHQTGGDGEGENRGEGDGNSAIAGNVGGSTPGGQGQGDQSRGNATEDPDTANPADAGAQANRVGTAGGNEFKVYQVMNKNASETDELAIENPFAPFAVPLGVLFVGAGGLESLLWFRFQRRGIAFAANAVAAG